MPKCLRCGITRERRDQYKDWIIITHEGPKQVTDEDIESYSFIDIPSQIIWSRHSMVGLCPDCQLPSEVVGCKDNPQLTEKGYNNLLGCLTTIEKRTAKLEREMDRVWEVIRCKGERE